jgi:hypothetical protein
MIELQESQICGCFYCMATFGHEEIKDWIDDRDGKSAHCPKCGIDSVIGSKSGYPITKDFLSRMNEHFF